MGSGGWGTLGGERAAGLKLLMSTTAVAMIVHIMLHVLLTVKMHTNKAYRSTRD